MIQRQQTLWLLLSTVAGIFSFMFPFATGEVLEEKTGLKKAFQLTASHNNFFILLLSIACIGVAAVTIFLYKDRKLQIKLTLLGLLLSIVLLVLYFIEMQKLLASTPALWAVLPLAIVIGFFMAYRGIRKDERLVKSLNKLR